jgi:hypothetical protein
MAVSPLFSSCRERLGSGFMVNEVFALNIARLFNDKFINLYFPLFFEKRFFINDSDFASGNDSYPQLGHFTSLQFDRGQLPQAEIPCSSVNSIPQNEQ